MQLNLHKVLRQAIWRNVYYILLVILVLSFVPYIYSYYAIPISIYISSNITLGSQLNPYFLGLFFLYIVMQLCHFTALILLGLIVPNINKSLFQVFLDNLYSIKKAYLNINSGKITKCLFDLTENVNDILICFIQFVFDPVITILLSVQKIYKSEIPYIFIVSITWVLFVSMIFICVSTLVSKYNSQATYQKQKVSGLLSDVLNNLFISRIFGAQPLKQQITKETEKENYYSYYTFFSLGLLKGTIAALNIAIFFGLLYTLINFTNMDTFHFSILEAMFKGIMLSLWRLTLASTDLIRKFTIVKQSMSYLNNLPLYVNNDSYKDFIPQKKIIDHTIEIKNLNLCFDKNIIFQNANLTIAPRETIILKGYSGSGKTTLLGMICGLITTKDILFDKVSMYHINNGWIQQNITYISQSHMLYNTSILENITLGKQYDEQKLQDVLQLCNIDSLVNQFKHGLQEIIGVGGSKISGGQKQRICIARALLFDRPENLLICDEIFNHLDQENVDKIKSIITSICANRTAIIVNHNKIMDEHGRKVYIEKCNFVTQ